MVLVSYPEGSTRGGNLLVYPGAEAAGMAITSVAEVALCQWPVIGG
jgi:hypothetical protein